MKFYCDLLINNFFSSYRFENYVLIVSLVHLRLCLVDKKLLTSLSGDIFNSCECSRFRRTVYSGSIVAETLRLASSTWLKEINIVRLSCLISSSVGLRTQNIKLLLLLRS